MIEEGKIKSKLKIKKPKKIGVKKSILKKSIPKRRKKKEYSDFIGGNSEVGKYTKGAFLGGLVGYQINKESNKKSNIKN